MEDMGQRDRHLSSFRGSAEPRSSISEAPCSVEITLFFFNKHPLPKCVAFFFPGARPCMLGGTLVMVAKP